MGPSFGTAADMPAVPVVQAECMAFDPEAAREPSRAVCSFSRKSKPFTVAIALLAVQLVQRAQGCSSAGPPYWPPKLCYVICYVYIEEVCLVRIIDEVARACRGSVAEGCGEYIEYRRGRRLEPPEAERWWAGLGPYIRSY